MEFIFTSCLEEVNRRGETVREGITAFTFPEGKLDQVSLERKMIK